MQNFSKIKPRFWVLLLTILGVTFAVAYSSQQKYIERQQEKLASLYDSQAELIEQNAILQRKIDFTFTDEYLEREARNRLDMLKEGEILYETNE